MFSFYSYLYLYREYTVSNFEIWHSSCPDVWTLKIAIDNNENASFQYYQKRFRAHIKLLTPNPNKNIYFNPFCMRSPVFRHLLGIALYTILYYRFICCCLPPHHHWRIEVVPFRSFILLCSAYMLLCIELRVDTFTLLWYIRYKKWPKWDANREEAWRERKSGEKIYDEDDEEENNNYLFIRIKLFV